MLQSASVNRRNNTVWEQSQNVSLFSDDSTQLGENEATLGFLSHTHRFRDPIMVKCFSRVFMWPRRSEGTCRCWSLCTCTSWWGSIMSVSPSAGPSSRGDRWEEGRVTPAAAATSTAGVRQPMVTAPSCQHAHTHISCCGVKTQKMTERDVEFQIDLMKCFNFHISNKGSRTSVVKNSLICWQVMMKSSSFFSPLSLIQRLYYRH